MKESVGKGLFRQSKFILVTVAVLLLLYFYSTVSTTKSSDTNVEYVELNLENMHQTDMELVKYVRIRHLTPPSRRSYNLDGTHSRDKFSAWIANFFKNKTGGTFIEAGANSGEHESHTLYLEKELGWSGLLIECNPTVVPYLRSKHRNAWIADVCLSPTSYPAILNFSNPTDWTYSGTLGKPWKLPKSSSWTFFDVQAIPFYSLLAALQWTEVDYFSFDIEGQELAVLRNFPFRLFTFKVLIVEDMFYTPGQKKELNELLERNDYLFVERLHHDNIYVHKSVSNLISSRQN